LDSDLLDSELPTSINATEVNAPVRISQLKISNIGELVYSIVHQKGGRIGLFTSGTTGLPKLVEHSISTFIRSVIEGKDKRENVWGFAYNPTHMAGLQVFFQALFNENSIINLFSESRKHIFDLLVQYKITHISATPTFYRILLPNEISFDGVERVTSGGEKMSTHLREQIKLMFPNAKFQNIYASTEAGSLLISDGNEFLVKPKFSKFLKIQDGELLIHQSVIGKASDIIFKDGWYHSGDLVRIIKENPLTFIFLSRKNEMINVGGYKVNPLEIEEVLCKHPQVRRAKVYSKENSVLGNILCCELELINSALSEPEIRKYLRQHLQEYKIPRVIKFVDSIQLSRTGKISRS
jgi:acyl-coenzyme A synthetase/AMP-(fatty) acid ligase